jgi:hypothetical protein
MPTFEATRVVTAPRGRVWDVISDVAGLAAHAPDLSASELVEGEGEGMVRRCYNKAGDGWSETFAGRVLGALMRPAFARTCRKMLDSYEAVLRVLPAIQLDGR